MCRLIELSNDEGMTIVDDEEFHRLNSHIWCRDGGYSVRWGELPGGRSAKIYMHRDVMNFPKGFDVDHINGDKLDNRKENLRAVTKQQNQFNRGAVKGSISQYKGVSWFPKRRLWRATIRIDKKYRHIGLFATEIEAAGAYNAMAIEHHDDYRRLNDVPVLSDWMERKAFVVRGRSRYRGVYLEVATNKWGAKISFKNKRISIGCHFDTEVDAAKAYNRMALELRGDKAVLNHILARAVQ